MYAAILNINCTQGKVHLMEQLYDFNVVGEVYRGFSLDVISSQFCKSWPDVGIYNKMSRYFLFSSYHFTKLRLYDKNIKTHARLKIQILL